MEDYSGYRPSINNSSKQETSRLPPSDLIFLADKGQKQVAIAWANNTTDEVGVQTTVLTFSVY